MLQGDRSSNKVWTPDNAHEILEPLHSLPPSELAIEAVVSRMITTLNGPFGAPLIAAVASVEIFIVLKPKILAKYKGTVACVFTVTAFASAGVGQAIPREDRQFN
jgi:hypothetical protein